MITLKGVSNLLMCEVATGLAGDVLVALALVQRLPEPLVGPVCTQGSSTTSFELAPKVRRNFFSKSLVVKSSGIIILRLRRSARLRGYFRGQEAVTSAALPRRL